MTLDLWKEREGEKCTRPRVYVRSIDFPRNYPRRNASRCVAHTHSRLRISRGRGLEKQKRGGGGGREDKRVRTRRGNNAAHCRTSRVCIMRSRAVSRIRFSCRCGSVDREETRYLSNKLGNICDTLYAQVSPRRAGRTHNKRMRITNAAVRYRVSGDNYIGRKNDTELRAIRWQREITPAMHFFFSLLQGRNYRAKLLTRRGAS